MTVINGKTSHIHEWRRLTITMAILLKLIYEVSTILIKIPTAFLCINKQADPKIQYGNARDPG